MEENNELTTLKTIVPAIVSTKKTSRYWSKREIKKLMRIVKKHPDTREGHGDGFREAAIYFGVSLNSIQARYYHSKNGTRKGKVERNTTKIPVITKKRKYTLSGKYKARATKDSGKIIPLSAMVATPALRSLTFDIQDVKVDLVNKKLTIIY